MWLPLLLVAALEPLPTAGIAVPNVGTLPAVTSSLHPGAKEKKPRLVLTVYPNLAMSFAPATIEIKVRIPEPAETDRLIVLELASSGGFYSSSQHQMEGTAAAKLWAPPRFHDLPEGTYTIAVTLYDWRGQIRAVVQHSLTLIGREGLPDF